MSPLKKIVVKTETQLFFFLLYVASLAYVGIASRSWKSVLFVHLFFALLYAVMHFGARLLLFLIAPIIAILQPFTSWAAKRYLKKFKQDVPAEAAIILGHSDWFKFEAWFKHNYLVSELKALVRYLEAKRQDFSFYPNAHFVDVEAIMRDKQIKEVYFFGHGDSHCFQLGTEDILYYCDFNDPEYGKSFAHQIHCGTPYGKSLLDYVVPEENRPKCFFFRKPINSFDIMRELRKRRTKTLQSSAK